MSWKYKFTDHGNYGTIPAEELKHKCPCCKKVQNFKRIDINSSEGMVFCEGEYMPIYRCDKCWIIIGVGVWEDVNDMEGEK